MPNIQNFLKLTHFLNTNSTQKKMKLKFLQILSYFLPFLTFAASSTHSLPFHDLLLPSDAISLLAFKSKADLPNNLRFNTSFSHCKWPGVQCQRHGKVFRVVIQGLNLGGVFSSDTLTRLDQLRVLSLQNNSLTGPIPDLVGLVNLKALFLDHNRFSSSVPPSLPSLHRLRTLDLSHNNLSGVIPPTMNNLGRLYYLRLDSNGFTGSIPPLNQSTLQVFNVSDNNLTGAVPVTPTLIRFGPSSFLLNFRLCGEIVRKECSSAFPFFGNSTEAASPPGTTESAELQGVALARSNANKQKRTAVIIGFSVSASVLISAIMCLLMAISRHKKNQKDLDPMIMAADMDAAAAMIRMEEANELEEKVRKLQVMQVGKSGNLVFCAGEAQVYSLEQLMTAAAELLGRGTVATTYKAVLDNRLIVCVKRLDALKLAGTSKEVFEQHMAAVGGLRHPNLVPLRAYFQAKEERLLVYDYQPNGSLFSLIHGSKSSRAKPLHWTSCLKIAEDVAQGLAYIHQAWRLVHGNLKSSNVLLGPDFEACLTDYCLTVLADISDNQDNPDFYAYKAPEIRKLNQQETAKSDVYSFGVLLLELLTGKPPLEHPNYVMPDDLMKWVKSTRDGEGCGDENGRMEMLLEVAIACSVTSPEQRPTMWQVLKMIQEIKEAIVMEDYELEPSNAAASIPT